MFTVDLKESTEAELRQELAEKGLGSSEIDQYVKEVNGVQKIKDFPDVGPVKALVVNNPGNSLLMLGVTIELTADGKLQSVSFPKTSEKASSLLLASKSSSSGINGRSYMSGFTQWELPKPTDPKYPDLFILTGRNGVGKTQLLKYIYRNLGGDHNAQVFFLGKHHESYSNSLIDFFPGYENNKRYALSIARDEDSNVDDVLFEDDTGRYSFVKGTLNEIAEMLKTLPAAILDNDNALDEVIIRHIASSLQRDANNADNFFSGILTCFRFLGKEQEFIQSFTRNIQAHGFMFNVKLEDELSSDGTIKWRLETPEGTLINYDDLSSGQKALFNFISWSYRIPDDLGDAFDMRYKVMLLDEPDMHLDPDLAKELFKSLSFFTAEGIQVIMTTHRIDTVSLAREGSVFTIEDKAIIPCTKMDALLRMTQNSRELVSLKAPVFTESHNDMLFYSIMRSHLARVCQTLTPTQLLSSSFFSSIGVSDRKQLLSRRYLPEFLSVAQDADGGKGGTKQVATSMARETAVLDKKKSTSGGDANLGLHYPFAILDNDYGDGQETVKSTDVLKGRTLVIDRHSLESFLFDPMILFSILSRDDIDQYFEKTTLFDLHAQDCIKWSQAKILHQDELQNAISDYFIFFAHTILNNLLLIDNSHVTGAVIRICSFLGCKLLPKDLWKTMFDNGKIPFNQPFLQQFSQTLAVDQKSLGTPTKNCKVDFLSVIRNVFKAEYPSLCTDTYTIAETLALSQTASIKYVNTALGHEVTLLYPRFFIDFRGHNLEDIFVKKFFTTGGTITIDNFVIDKLREATGFFFPSDLAQMFFGLDRKISDQMIPIVTPHKTSIVPPTTALVSVAAPVAPPPTSPTTPKINWFYSRWRDWQYRQELQRLEKILKEHKITLTPKEALASKLYRGQLIKIHPDKIETRKDPALNKKALEDAQFYQKFVEEFNNPHIQKTNTVQYSLQGLSTGIRMLDTTTEIIRTSYDVYNLGKWDNIGNLAVSASSLLATIPKFSKYHIATSLVPGVASISYQFWNNDYIDAIKSSVTLAIFTAAPYAIMALSPLPGTGHILTAGIIFWSGYNTEQNILSLCEEHKNTKTYVDSVCEAVSLPTFWTTTDELLETKISGEAPEN